MTAPDLDALARETIALGEAATPGPWRACCEDRAHACKSGLLWLTGEACVSVLPTEDAPHPSPEQMSVDLVTVAAYRTSAPALATALLEAREAMREARSAAAGRNPRKAMAILDRALRSGAGEKEAT